MSARPRNEQVLEGSGGCLALVPAPRPGKGEGGKGGALPAGQDALRASGHGGPCRTRGGSLLCGAEGPVAALQGEPFRAWGPHRQRRRSGRWKGARRRRVPAARVPSARESASDAGESWQGPRMRRELVRPWQLLGLSNGRPRRQIMVAHSMAIWKPM